MKKMGLLLLAWLPVSPLAFPQSTPATTLVSGPNAALPPAQVITLGNSVVPLEQGWKFEPGDYVEYLEKFRCLPIQYRDFISGERVGLRRREACIFIDFTVVSRKVFEKSSVAIQSVKSLADW